MAHRAGSRAISTKCYFAAHAHDQKSWRSMRKMGQVRLYLQRNDSDLDRLTFRDDNRQAESTWPHIFH